MALNLKYEIIAALTTFLAALFSLFVEYQEKLPNSQHGTIYEAFGKLGEVVYRSKDLKDKLDLAISHIDSTDSKKEIQKLIVEANSLCRELNQIRKQFKSHLPPQ